MRTEHTRCYRIKPLKWKKAVSDNYMERWDSDHTFQVERRRDRDNSGWGPWRVTWCFIEHYDESEREVESLAAGKRWADEDNIKRLLPRLTEVHKLTF